MEINLIVGFLIGCLLGGFTVWIFIRQGRDKALDVANAESNALLAVANEKYTSIEKEKNTIASQSIAANKQINELRQENKDLMVNMAAEQQKNKNNEEQLEVARTEAKVLSQQLDAVKNELQKSQQDLVAAVATLKSERQTLATSAKLLDDAKLALTKELNLIVQQIPSKVSMESKEKFDELLKPFKENMEGLRKTVADATEAGVSKNAALSQQIKSFSEQSIKVNETVVNLTNALKGNSKTQGTWGEQILERLLEISGLRKDIDYEVQKSVRDEDGSVRRPDCVVNLPDGKRLVIDSKVSITAYEAHTRSEKNEDLQHFAKEHLNSIKKHVTDLASKNYEKLVPNAPNFTLLFIPIDAAFSLAMSEDENLFQFAMSKGIVFATPMTLLPVLRTIDFIWKQEQQQKNVKEIIRQTTALYEKFVGFVENLDDVENRLTQAQKSLADSKKQMLTGAGSLVRRVENIKTLGLKPAKSIPTGWLDDAAVNTTSPLRLENEASE
jgi:DNA recombination protein RmuC